MNETTLIHYGGEVKALGGGKFEAPLIQYGDETKHDLARDFFTAETDLWTEFPARVPLLYSHGLDKTIKRKRLGEGKAQLEQTDAGIWMRGQLDIANEYEKKIYELIDARKMGTSSGSAPHLVEREAVGNAFKITSWPVVEASLTPCPCEVRNMGMVLPLKSLPTLLDPYPYMAEMVMPSGADDLASEMTMAAVSRLQDRMWSVIYRNLNATDEPLPDRIDAIRESVQQFGVILTRTIESIMGGAAADTAKSAAAFIKHIYIDGNTRPPVGRTLAEEGETALLVVNAWTDRLKDANAKREAKDGRVLSTANRAKIKAAIDVLAELYDMTEPRASEDDVQKALTAYLQTEARLLGVAA